MSEWINVDDMLPQYDIEVIAIQEGNVTVGCFRAGSIEGEWWFDGDVTLDGPSHWMEIPDLP